MNLTRKVQILIRADIAWYTLQALFDTLLQIGRHDRSGRIHDQNYNPINDFGRFRY